MKTKIVSLNLEEKQVIEIDKLAEQFHMSRSQFVRFVLRRGTGFSISILKDFPDIEKLI